MEDRKLDAEEKLKLIQKIIDSEGLYAINEYLQNIISKEDKEIANESSNIELTSPVSLENPIKKEDNIPSEVSIYRQDAIKLVEQDNLTHPLEEQEKKEEILKAPVKKLVNNPWATAEGIKTVSPGELNLN